MCICAVCTWWLDSAQFDTLSRQVVFVLLKEIHFQRTFFSKQVYIPLLSCKFQRLLFCGIFTAPVRVWVFLKHEVASLIWRKCIFKAPLRKRNSICMKCMYEVSFCWYEFGVYWRCIAELNYSSNWETFQISLRLLNINSTPHRILKVPSKFLGKSYPCSIDYSKALR